MTTVIILMGPPGSGKGTQSMVLKDLYSIAHISTGDILRNEISVKSEIGLKIKDILSRGELINDKLMTEILESRVQQEDCNNGFILDGYPRTSTQAELLDEIFKKKDINKYFVFAIDIADEVVLKRILGRFTCSKCGEIYNKYFHNPKKDGICDKCHSVDFIVRTDDNEEVIKDRIQLYKDQSESIFKYYGDKVVKIDGLLSIEDYKQQVIKVISK